MKPNVFEVYKDNKLLNQSAEMKDYQEVLENQIIKVNHKSFCQVVVLGSATFQPFMQLTAQQRREIIEDLLDLQIFTSMNSLLKDKVLLNTESINKSTSDIKLIEEKITLIKEHLVEMQSNNEKIIEEKKQRVKDTVEQVKKLTDEHKAALIVCEKLQEQLKDEEAVSKKINKLRQLKHQIEANLGIINKEVNFFHKYDNCPTCKQQIDEQFKSETVETKQKEIENIQNGLEKLAIEYENTNNKLNDLIIVHADINSKKLELNSIKTKINSLLEYRETLDEEINRIAKQSPIKEDNKIPDLEKQLKEIQTEYSKYLEEKNILSVASALLKDGGIKSKIVKQYVPIINKLINKYLSAMEFMCQFELDEQFNETIKSRYRDIFSYSSFSEGEKMRINLAILFAWRAIAKLRNSINTNLLIMDEVFDSSLDSNGTDEFLKIIKNLTSDTNTFIISHKTDQLYDKFEKVIKFEKHKNFSKIAA
jgi:DNA repair exonuclease SbcCD ATPase subunit